MSRGVSWQCANCGANLEEASPGAAFIKCHFCGQVTALEPPEPAPVPIEVIERPRIVVRPRRRSSGIVPMLVLMAGLLAFSKVMQDRRMKGRDVLRNITAAVEPERIHWDSGVWTWPARVNGDPTEDFVGAFTRDAPSGGTSQRFVAAYDGVTIRPLWEAGPYGSGSDPGFEVAVCGSHVVVTDVHLTVHVLSLATGKETVRATLSDRATNACPLQGGDEAWIGVSDQQDVIVDLRTGQTKKASRPAYCNHLPWEVTTRDISCETGRYSWTRAACQGVDGSFKVPNFEAGKMLTDAETTVVVGTKSPGSAVPIALGYDPHAKHVLWQRPIAEEDPATVSDGLGMVDLGSGRLVAQVELRSRLFRLEALDAKTGATEWDTEIPNSNDGSEAERMTITATRVYLPHWTWLDIFDASTGHYVGRVGRW